MKAYCINLLSRPDRWFESMAEFTRLGLTVEHFAATSGPNTVLAFNDSQYRAIKAGYDSGADGFLVLEDDCAFDAPWSKVEDAMRDLPYGWDALYLGCNITTDGFRQPDRVSDRLARLWDCWQSHACIWSRKGAQWILENTKPDEWPIHDEKIRGGLMKQGNIYLIAPMICYQRESFSDIWGVKANYTSVHVHGNRQLQMI